VSSFIGSIFNNIYSFIIGRSFTAADLGFYSQADRIKNACSHTTTQVIQSVTYPILTKLDKGAGELKEGYKKIIATSLIFVGFIMVLFMGCACDLFELLMGDEKWRVTGTFFMLLGINGILYPLHSINQNILMVKGKSKTILFLEITRRIIMITIIAIPMQFDIKYFVFSLSVYSFLLLFMNLYYCGKPINYSVTEQLKDILPIFTRLAIIFIVTYFTGEMLSAMNISLRVLTSLLVGGITGLIIFWNYRHFKASLALLKSIIKK
jgi:O-antigen/teichoic acid export membrane protein